MTYRIIIQFLIYKKDLQTNDRTYNEFYTYSFKIELRVYILLLLLLFKKKKTFYFILNISYGYIREKKTIIFK